MNSRDKYSVANLILSRLDDLSPFSLLRAIEFKKHTRANDSKNPIGNIK